MGSVKEVGKDNIRKCLRMSITVIDSTDLNSGCLQTGASVHGTNCLSAQVSHLESDDGG